mmetsp:Transcript_24906/g.36832  ORF Transcript_24906/g.36832 Transcript_24906/m.36832 type:complete len:455 (-) Transcript_24906:11-1375(-)
MTNDLYRKGREKAFSLLGIKTQRNTESTNVTTSVQNQSSSDITSLSSRCYCSKMEPGFTGSTTDDGDAAKLRMASTAANRRYQYLSKLSATRSKSTAYKRGREQSLALLGIDVVPKLEHKPSTEKLSLSALQKVALSCQDQRGRSDTNDFCHTNNLHLSSCIAARRNIQLRRVFSQRDPMKNEAYKRGRDKAFYLLGCLKKDEDTLSSCNKIFLPSTCAVNLSETRELQPANPLSLASIIASKRYLDLKETVPGRNDIIDETYEHGRDEALAMLRLIRNQETNEITNEPDISIEKQVAIDQRCYKSDNLDAPSISSCGSSDSECMFECLESEKLVETFPRKLHRLLTELEAAGRENTISFLPHGRAFVINCEVKFVHESMPNYFRVGRLTSFERQLYLHGFRKVSSGPDRGAYFHELFQKNHPELVAHIKRIDKKPYMKKVAEKMERRNRGAAA